MESDKYMDLNNEFVFQKEYSLFRNIVTTIKKQLTDKSLYQNMQIGMKEWHEVYTSIDLSIEKTIVSMIKEVFPNDYIVSEESYPELMTGTRCWIIDPIDGTGNLANQIPLYGVQAVFIYNNIPELGFIYLPALDECFFAAKGQGAFLNGLKIYAKAEEDIKSMTICMGDFSKKNKRQADLQANVMSTVKDHVYRIRMLGSAGVDFCFLAAGRVSAHVMFSGDLWDIAPGLLIAEEAGCLACSLYGAELDLINTKGVIASSSKKFIEFFSSEVKRISGS